MMSAGGGWTNINKALIGTPPGPTMQAIDAFHTALNNAKRALDDRCLDHETIQVLVHAYRRAFTGTEPPPIWISPNDVSNVCDCAECGPLFKIAPLLVVSEDAINSTGVFVGEETYASGAQRLAKFIPALDKCVAVCPDPRFYSDGRMTYDCKATHGGDLMTLIMHLNDEHKWTRERIADWLDELAESGVDLTFKKENA